MLAPENRTLLVAFDEPNKNVFNKNNIALWLVEWTTHLKYYTN